MTSLTRLATSFAILTLSFPASAFTITQADSGKTIEVTPLMVSANEVTFALKGREHTIPLTTLTEESREALQDWQNEKNNRLDDGDQLINEVIGHPLFGGEGTLWEQPAGVVAKRLEWAVESANPNSLSFRSYPRSSYGFLNAHPYCCTLYGDSEGLTSHFSLVFANKGDFGSTVGSGEDHFKPQGDLPPPKHLNEAIELDATVISERLTKALGNPQSQYYGEKEDKRRVQRWNHGPHSFILSEEEDEYTHLLIVPHKTADAQGKVDLIKDSDMKARLLANVRKKPNGDTIILNIPMVDQGPKGYCAPATFERAMRYVSIPADMYLLATLATLPGGGTNTQLLAEESKRIVRSKARKIRNLDLSDDLSFRTVAGFVDKGIPLLWQMASLEQYNEIANERTAQREKVEDFAKWTNEIAEEAEEVAPLLHKNANHHICMIVGYNEATQELAVSDSWGPDYELRWIHIDIAKKVTSYGGFAIDI